MSNANRGTSFGGSSEVSAGDGGTLVDPSPRGAEVEAWPSAGGAAPTEVIALRHGETEWNVEGRFQGHDDSPLTPLGERQARALARSFRGERVDAIYSSDLPRALKTAEETARMLGLGIRLEPRLRERHYGQFEGRTIDEIARLFPENHARYLARDPAFAAEGGESSLAKHARVLACLSDLVARHPGGRIVLVTHGGVLDSLYRHAMDLPYPAARPTPLLNGSRNVFRVDSDRCRLVSWGELPPLDPVS